MEAFAPIFGMIMVIVGFVIVLVSGGVLIYSFWPRSTGGMKPGQTGNSIGGESGAEQS